MKTTRLESPVLSQSKVNSLKRFLIEENKRGEEIVVGSIFKAIKSVVYYTDRGEDEGLIEGTVLKVVGDIVFLQGIFFPFKIHIQTYLEFNKFKN